MTQINFATKSRSKPILEFRQTDAGEIRRVAIESSPFTIGRSDTCDLQIESAQISRAHAQIVDRNGAWIIRDLNSTNGTQVNGKTVTEVLLSDGDILLIAEMEFTFVASSSAQFQRMVTQPMHHRPPAISAAAFPAEISSARALIEATLWQIVPVEMTSLASLSLGSVEAYFAQVTSVAEMPSPGRLFGMQHPAGERYRELHRVRAIEMFGAVGGADRLFVTVDEQELLKPQQLRANIERASDLLPEGSELGIMLSLSTLLDTLRIEAAYRGSHREGLLIAFDEFEGGGKQVMQLDAFVPDYLILADSMLNHLTTAPHALRRLESVLAACDELAIKPVIPRGKSDRTLAQCQQIGFDLALRTLASPQQQQSPVELAPAVL